MLQYVAGPAAAAGGLPGPRSPIVIVIVLVIVIVIQIVIQIVVIIMIIVIVIMIIVIVMSTAGAPALLWEAMTMHIILVVNTNNYY